MTHNPLPNDLQEPQDQNVVCDACGQEHWAVQRFYFHLNFTDGVVLDPDGSALADLLAAENEARQAIRDLVAECLRSRRALTLRSIRICNTAGVLAGEVLLQDAIKDVIRLEDLVTGPAHTGH